MKAPSIPLLALLLSAVFWISPRAFADLIISEIMADNDRGLADEDGEYPDWIEIANTGTEAVELGGYSLTDKVTDLKRWKFPPTTLEAGGYLVVFASGKDRDPAGGELHTNFVLDSSGEYLGLVAPDGVTVVAGFSPRYPTQAENVSFGMGVSGSVTPTDATPTWVGSGNYASMRISGVAAASPNNSPNSFDNGSGASQTQMYMWLDLGEKLATLPAAEKKVISAVLKWSGDVKATNGGATVETKVGLYPVTDGVQGKMQLAETFSGDELVRFAAANQAVSSVTATPGTTVDGVWDVSELVQGWIDGGDLGAGLEVMLVTDSRPVWIGWEKNGAGNAAATLDIVTTSAVGGGLVPLYFDTATPGETNAGGAVVGPYFGDVTRHPEQPVVGDLTITAQAAGVDGRMVESVNMYFRKMRDAEQMAVMQDDGTGGDEVAGDGIYTAVIPGSFVEPGMMVRWRFEAVDSAGLLTKEPPHLDGGKRESEQESNEYWGTVGHDASIETNLNVLHWFVEPRLVPRANPGPIRASFYYRGELYDNVKMSIHGQSTRGGNFPKKSYNLDFNRTQNFRWHPDRKRAKDMDILGNWADKSKVRHLLSWEVMRNAGVHAHEMSTIRVQLNGEFYMLSDLIENGDADYLERAGLDPDGALYKMFNRFNSYPGDASSSAEKKSRKWENKLDIRNFLQGVTSGSSATKQRFMWDHLDIPKTVNMLAARSLTGMTDFGHKNYYLYR
ncbi:MAG: CotH kinase family protein, partial [Verrucomicrobiales bacterium]|nr:CotH kinase family protein [Verrucomicrobiales bacterium]